nr:protein kinase, ATP binding site-containing protein [Tanacetum cinerariifolium]
MVYEYFTPKTLYDILTSDDGVIGWADRLEICIRVAKVLNYLHSGFVAYKCISFDIKERPEMDEIVRTIEKALDIHNYGSALQNFQGTIKKFEISLDEIRKAIGAENFYRRVPSKRKSRNIRITHRGKLVGRCNDREAFFKHWTPEGYNERKPKRILN